MNVIEEEKKVDGYIKASEVISLNTNNKHHFVVDSVKAPIDNDTEARRQAMRDQVMEKVPKKSDFTELKSLANPPIIVCNLLEIFMKLIYNQEPGWANAKVCL